MTFPLRTSFLAGALAAVLAVPAPVVAQEGRIELVWVDHNVFEGPLKGMRIHVRFQVSGLRSIPCRAVAYFAYADGAALQDFDNFYFTSDGQVSAGTDFTPIYPDATFQDLQIFMPYDQLHMQAGHHELQFHVELYTQDGDYHFAESQPVSFTFDQPEA